MSIEQSAVIDFVAQDPSGEVLLVMVEGREWDGSDERLFELQEKINTYVSFARDGEMLEKYPALARRPVTLELRCVSLPDPKTAQFLEMVREKLTEVGLAFRSKQVRSVPLG
jgi:hypothetical protein